MWSKGGMNDYAVFVVKPCTYQELQEKCAWLGHSRYKCGHCKNGYFNVKSCNEHDEECPECHYNVVVRWQD